MAWLMSTWWPSSCGTNPPQTLRSAELNLISVSTKAIAVLGIGRCKESGRSSSKIFRAQQKKKNWLFFIRTLPPTRMKRKSSSIRRPAPSLTLGQLSQHEEALGFLQANWPAQVSSQWMTSISWENICLLRGYFFFFCGYFKPLEDLELKIKVFKKNRYCTSNAFGLWNLLILRSKYFSIYRIWAWDSNLKCILG